MDENFVRKFLKGSLSTSFGTISTIAFHFLSISIMSRYVSKEILGLYFLIIAIATAGKILSSLGLDLTLVQFLVSEADDTQQQAFAAIIWTRILTLLILATVIYVGGSFILMQFDARLIAYRWAVVLLFGLMSFRELFFYILQGLHQFSHYAFIQVTSAILKFCLTVVFRDTLNLTSLLLIEFAMLGGSLILQLWVVPIKRLSPARFLFQPSIIPKIFRYGFPLYSNSLLTHVSDFGGTYIVGIFLSPLSIAAYEIAKKIPDGFRRLFIAFHVVYFPHLSSLFAQADLKSAQKLLNKSLTLLSTGAFALTLFTLLFSHELVLLVFSERYLEVQPAFVLIMFAVCLQLLANTMGYSLVSADLPSYSTRVNIIAMGLELALSIFFVPLMGYIGIGVSYVIMTLISQVMCYFYLRRARVFIDLQVYSRPFIILAATAVPYLLIGSDALAFRMLIFAAYILLCLLFIPACRHAILYLWHLAQASKFQTGHA